MDAYDLAEAAERSGVDVDELGRLVELGIITPDAGGRFGSGHVRKIGLVKSLVASGIPLEGLGAAIRSGAVTLDFLDASAFDRFSAFSGQTFAQLAERTGVPVELLMFVREASGSVAARPDDRVRDEELRLRRPVRAGGRIGDPHGRHPADGPDAERQHAAHRRDGVGDVAGRGDRAGDDDEACVPTRSSGASSAIG